MHLGLETGEALSHVMGYHFGWGFIFDLADLVTVYPSQDSLFRISDREALRGLLRQLRALSFLRFLISIFWSEVEQSLRA